MRCDSHRDREAIARETAARDRLRLLIRRSAKTVTVHAGRAVTSVPLRP